MEICIMQCMLQYLGTRSTVNKTYFGNQQKFGALRLRMMGNAIFCPLIVCCIVVHTAYEKLMLISYYYWIIWTSFSNTLQCPHSLPHYRHIHYLGPFVSSLRAVVAAVQTFSMSLVEQSGDVAVWHHMLEACPCPTQHCVHLQVWCGCDLVHTHMSSLKLKSTTTYTSCLPYHYISHICIYACWLN